jgi:hypothetical protein
MWPTTIAATDRYQIAEVGMKSMLGAAVRSGSATSEGSQSAPWTTTVRSCARSYPPAIGSRVAA